MDYASVPEHFSALDELDELHRCTSPGRKLELVPSAGRALRETIGASGVAKCVRTYDIATFPYPTRYALEGVARSPAPYVMMRNRMQLVETYSQGQMIRILINPSDPERSKAAPFFAQQIERYGEMVTGHLLSSMHGSVESHLQAAGIAPESVDYITFDHLHVQDVRGLLGAGGAPGSLPNARLIAQRAELLTWQKPHPLQCMWYVPGASEGLDPAKIIAIDGDVLVGEGTALVRTPGHTAGNHSPVLCTDRGLWTISENGVAVESYAPLHSRIRGVKKHAEEAQVEVILNANSREATLDQYTSMVLEKTIADACPDRPEFPQHFPSSELTRSRLSPGTAPTYSHGAITHGQLSSGA